AGQSFINSEWATSDAPGASEDYNKLFTLYQAINALQGVASAAQADGLTSTQLAAYQRRFAAGLEEIQDYIAKTGFDFVDLTLGTVTDTLKSTVGTARVDATYLSDPLYSGAASDAVPAFAGDIVFDLQVNRVGTAAPYEVAFDLTEMGDTPRSISNVVSYMNSKLQAAGLDTRVAVVTQPAVPETITVGGQTVEVSAGKPTQALQIKGVSYETLTFSAAETADAVYIGQSTGDAAEAGEDGADAVQPVLSQLLKFQDPTSGLAAAVPKVGYAYYSGAAQMADLPSAIDNVVEGVAGKADSAAQNALAMAAAPDGGVYVLANITAAIDGQEIKGAQDVALVRYDSAGNIVYTRTLGAADSAAGLGLAVSEDGRVAVVGSITGALNISNPTTEKNKYGLDVATGVAPSTASLSGSNAATTDSFVTVFDAEGNEEWTQRFGASGADTATSVAFTADGGLVVGGKTASAMPGGTATLGGTDSYIVGFSALGQRQFTVQTGTASADQTSRVAVDGATLYAASLEGGVAMLRTYDLSSGAAVLTGERSLGALGGGAISALSVYEGQVYVGGSSGTARLLEGAQVTAAFSGGYDAFALSVSQDLADTSADRIAFYGGSGTEANAQVAFEDGVAWIAGSTTGEIDGAAPLASGIITATGTVRMDGYLAKLDVQTGEVSYEKRYTGADGVVTVNAIAVAADGASALDRLGLPSGTIDFADSDLLVANSSVRAGDIFYIADPDTGAKKAITIAADETLKSLADKIKRASGREVDVEVKKISGKPQDQLVITPAHGGSALEFLSGPAGKDALAGMGLSPGLVIETDDEARAAQDAKPMGLEVDATLTLSSASAIAEAVSSLQSAMSNVRAVYFYLKYGDSSDEETKSSGKTGGTVPAYLTNQIANYQAALDRLTGGV
ncbi:MAG: transcriptional regulator, partial [Phenylobacterium zucineum]